MTFKTFVSCLLCLALLLVSGCGGQDRTTSSTTAISALTAAERAAADKLIAEHGKDAMIHYLDRYLVYEAHGGVIETQEMVLKHINYFVSQGTDVNARGTDGPGMTPLHWAARIGDIESAKILVSQGANVNAMVDHPQALSGTPLVFAILEGSIEVVKFLVSHGADANVKVRHPNGSGESTPLAIAREMLDSLPGETTAPPNLPKEMLERMNRIKTNLPEIVEFLSGRK